MMNLPDRASIEAALAQPLDPELHELLVETWRRAEAPDLLDLTHILVVQAGDTEEAIMEAIGFSPLVHPIDQVRFGEAGFQPYWAWLKAHPGWFELGHPVGNSGFAYILLISRALGTNGELLQMCHEHTLGKG